MAARIGILGQVPGVARPPGTYTVYTVPAGKGVRCRLMWAFEKMDAGAAGMSVLINDAVIWGSGPGWEAAKAAVGTFAKRDGTTGEIDPDTVALYNTTAEAKWVHSTAADDLDLLMPLNVDYYLSGGDTVKFNLTDGVRSHLFQVVGVEDDDGSGA